MYDYFWKCLFFSAPASFPSSSSSLLVCLVSFFLPETFHKYFSTFTHFAESDSNVDCTLLVIFRYFTYAFPLLMPIFCLFAPREMRPCVCATGLLGQNEPRNLRQLGRRSSQLTEHRYDWGRIRFIAVVPDSASGIDLRPSDFRRPFLPSASWLAIRLNKYSR